MKFLKWQSFLLVDKLAFIFFLLPIFAWTNSFEFAVHRDAPFLPKFLLSGLSLFFNSSHEIFHLTQQSYDCHINDYVFYPLIIPSRLDGVHDGNNVLKPLNEDD